MGAGTCRAGPHEPDRGVFASPKRLHEDVAEEVDGATTCEETAA